MKFRGFRLNVNYKITVEPSRRTPAADGHLLIVSANLLMVQATYRHLWLVSIYYTAISMFVNYRPRSFLVYTLTEHSSRLMVVR